MSLKETIGSLLMNFSHGWNYCWETFVNEFFVEEICLLIRDVCAFIVLILKISMNFDLFVMIVVECDSCNVHV